MQVLNPSALAHVSPLHGRLVPPHFSATLRPLATSLTWSFTQPTNQPPAAGSNYLAYIGLLNQVVMMGTQLYHDASVPQHHKYAAHQIALLYVSWG